MRAWRADARFFVDVEAETVTGPMSECVPQTARLEHIPGGGINRGRGDSGLDHLDGGSLSFSDGCMQPEGVCGGRPNRYSPGQVRAVSVQYAAEVQHDQVARLQDPEAGTIVRKRRVRA
jgi:hypothetical protein